MKAPEAPRRRWEDGATPQEIADLNSFPVGTVGHQNEWRALQLLDEAARLVAYGRAEQMMGHLRDVVIYGKKIKVSP